MYLLSSYSVLYHYVLCLFPQCLLGMCQGTNIQKQWSLPTRCTHAVLREAVVLRSDRLIVGHLPAETGLSVGVICGAETKSPESLESSLGCKSPEDLLCILFLRLPCVISLTVEQSASCLHWTREASGVAAVISLIHW